MKALLIVFILTLTIPGYGQVQQFQVSSPPEIQKNHQISKMVDAWFGTDKARHLIGSFILSGLSQMSLQRYARRDIRSSKAIGFGLSISVGLGKEIWDSSRKDNIFSYKDLTADILGSLLAVFIVNMK